MGLLDRALRVPGKAGAVPPGGSEPGGLLFKASGKRPDLDGMEKACVDRIMRVPSGPAAPFTSLSILKAFFSFHAGVALCRRGDEYRSYLEVGVGSPDGSGLSVPASNIPEPASLPAELEDSSALGLPPESFGRTWLFPLEADSVLALAADDAFDAVSLNKVLASCSSRFRNEPATPGTASPDIEQFVYETFSELGISGKLQFAVVDIASCADAADAVSKAAAFISSVGSAAALGPTRMVAAVKTGIDVELLAHRLRKSLSPSFPGCDFRLLEAFEVDGPQAAIEKLAPFA